MKRQVWNLCTDAGLDRHLRYRIVSECDSGAFARSVVAVPLTRSAVTAVIEAIRCPDTKLAREQPDVFKRLEGLLVANRDFYRIPRWSKTVAVRG